MVFQVSFCQLPGGFLCQFQSPENQSPAICLRNQLAQKPKEVVKETVNKEESPEQVIPEVDLSFANLGMENSNEEILRLHKEGKSNVVIAKELGLGVGEVKLVIDLFEGM